MMRRSTFACALLLALSASAFAQTPPRAAAPPPPPTVHQQIDALFGRLAAAKDSDETEGIIGVLDRLELQSGSDTSDLLMQRAVATMEQGNYPVSLSLLDAIVDLNPDWAEGWNKRATARYLAGDAKGAVADIAQTLSRDPRNLGALAGLGMILEDADQREQALRAYQRALAIAPHWKPMIEAEARVKAALAGQAL
jgi:tetratricopeptide (TPR) repeat protein